MFPRARKVTGSILPLETRWFLPRVEAIRGEQLLEIVRILDKQMNNTSVILLFEVGTKRLLFPGDAQLENWMYALKEAERRETRRRSFWRSVDVYKVGHHGSLNATPKTLWNLFSRKGASTRRNRLHDGHVDDGQQARQRRSRHRSAAKQARDCAHRREQPGQHTEADDDGQVLQRAPHSCVSRGEGRQAAADGGCVLLLGVSVLPTRARSRRYNKRALDSRSVWRMRIAGRGSVQQLQVSDDVQLVLIARTPVPALAGPGPSGSVTNPKNCW